MVLLLWVPPLLQLLLWWVDFGMVVVLAPPPWAQGPQMEGKGGGANLKPRHWRQGGEVALIVLVLVVLVTPPCTQRRQMEGKGADLSQPVTAKSSC